MTDAERRLLLAVADGLLTMATGFGWLDKAAQIAEAREALLGERRIADDIHESSSDLGHG